MHACICVITNEFPSQKIIEKKMEPYSVYREEDANESAPLIKWDSWEIGGRYCGRIKLFNKKPRKEQVEWNES